MIDSSLPLDDPPPRRSRRPFNSRRFLMLVGVITLFVCIIITVTIIILSTVYGDTIGQVFSNVINNTPTP